MSPTVALLALLGACVAVVAVWAPCGLPVAQGSAMPFLGNGSSRAIAHAPPAHSSGLSQPGREEQERQWGRHGPGTAQQGTAWH